MGLREKYGRHTTQALCGPSAAGTAGPKATKSIDLRTARGRLLSVGADAPFSPSPLPGRVTWKDVTVNGGGSAGGRGTPEAEAQCGV